MSTPQHYITLIEIYGPGRGTAVEQIHHEMLLQDAMDAAAPYRLTAANLGVAMDDMIAACMDRITGTITEDQYKARLAATAAMLTRELATYYEPEETTA